MSDKIHLWCGFCITTHRTKIDGKNFSSTWTAKGPPRNTANEAWEDARRFENEQEKQLKKEGARPGILQPGICPPDCLY